MPDTVPLVDPDGVARDVPALEVAGAVQRGWRPQTTADVRAAGTQASNTADYGGIHGAIGAGAAALARGATLGGSDVAARILGGQDAADTLAGLRSENPGISAGGELAGNLLPAVVTGGAATPAGLTSSLGRTIVEHAAGEGAGLAARAGAGMLGAGAEGALFGGGQYLSQVAIDDKPLTAEGFVASMGHGALFAAPVGGALTLGGATLLRARSLFPTSEISAAAAKGVSRDATTQLAQSVADGDTMAAAAQRRLEILDAKIGQAAAGENLTRSVFGGADPEALAAQGAGGAERAQVADAIDKYQASRARLHDWIATEADPELEREMAGLQSGRLQTIGAPSVPVGEFGAPGADGIKSPDELARAASDAAGGTETETVPADATGAYRRPARFPDGTPAEADATGANARPLRQGLPARGRYSVPAADIVQTGEREAAGVPSYERIKAYEAKADDYLEQTLPASAIKERGYYEPPGGHEDAVRTSNARKAIADGQHEAIKLNIAENGSITVTDGRHRLAAAIDANAPIKVKWSTGSPPAPSDVLRGPTSDGGAVASADELPDRLNRDQSAAASNAERARLPDNIKQAIDVYQPYADKARAGLRKCANGLCDSIEPQFRGMVKGLERKRFDLTSDDGIADVKRLYHMTDAQVASMRRLNDGRMRRLGVSKEAMFHQISVTNDGVAIDWTANQFNKLPVPYVFRLRPPQPASALESLLRGTQEQLAAGVEFKDIGAPASADYAAAKQAKTSAAAESYRARAAAREPEAGDATMARILAKHGLGPAQDSIGARIMASVGGETAPLEFSIGKALGRRAGKNVNIGADLERAANVLGDHEQALAGLVDVVGPQAPSAAAVNAAQLRASMAAQEEASGASAARAASDIGSKLGPAEQMSSAERAKIYGDKTVVDTDIDKAIRAHDAKLAAKTGRAKVAPEPPAPASTGATAPPRASGGLLGKAADAGTALEVLKALGVHVPGLGAIPVIGPILSVFLKARAVMGIIGRKGGSITRTTEGVIATKAAAARDRVNAATVSLLTDAGNAAGRASEIMAGPAVTLGTRLFPGGSEPASKAPEDLYAARIDEIARAQQPGAIDHAIGDRYQTADPTLHAALVDQVSRGIAFLDSKAPKQTTLPGMLPGDGVYKPSRAALEVFGRYVHAVNDPVSVLEDLAKGHVTLEGAETLRVVYPALFAQAQRTLLAAAPKMQATIPYTRRVMISVMFQLPIDGTMAPSHMQYLKTSASPAAPPPAAHATSIAITGPLTAGQQAMTALDRRAAGG